MGFRAWWRWKLRNLGGRPKISGEIRDLVHQENPLWGAPRIHGKLALTSPNRRFRLRAETAPSAFARMEDPSPHHADGIASVDFLTSTVMFELAEIGDKAQSLMIILAQVQKAASNNTCILCATMASVQKEAITWML